MPDTLAQRGYTGISEAYVEETLIQPERFEDYHLITTRTASVARELLEKLATKSFRIALRSSVYGIPIPTPIGEVSSYPFSPTPEDQRRFDKTMELLMAYLCVAELKASSASFGVKVGGTPSGGDFDCIANFPRGMIFSRLRPQCSSLITRRYRKR